MPSTHKRQTNRLSFSLKHWNSGYFVPFFVYRFCSRRFSNWSIFITFTKLWIRITNTIVLHHFFYKFYTFLQWPKRQKKTDNVNSQIFSNDSCNKSYMPTSWSCIATWNRQRIFKFYSSHSNSVKRETSEKLSKLNVRYIRSFSVADNSLSTFFHNIILKRSISSL